MIRLALAGSLILLLARTPEISTTANPREPSGARPKPEIIINTQGLRDANVGAAWLGYALAKWHWAVENLPDGSTRFEGDVDASFEEEAFGRQHLADFWERIRKQALSPGDSDLDDLLRVHEAGLIREYVWEYLHRADWGPGFGQSHRRIAARVQGREGPVKQVGGS